MIIYGYSPETTPTFFATQYPFALTVRVQILMELCAFGSFVNVLQVLKFKSKTMEERQIGAVLYQAVAGLRFLHWDIKIVRPVLHLRQRSGINRIILIFSIPFLTDTSGPEMWKHARH